MVLDTSQQFGSLLQVGAEYELSKSILQGTELKSSHKTRPRRKDLISKTAT
jgi:hypothetical protein